MKKNIRILITVILAVCLLVTVVGCGQKDATTGDQEGASQQQETSTNGQEDTSNTQDEEESTLDRIKESGKLVMGTNAEFEPFEYHEMVDGEPQIIGFDIDLSQIIADKLGVELVIEDMDFDGLIPALASKSIDMIAAGMSADEERAKSVNFSVSYFDASQVIIIREDDDSIKGREDLKGKKLGVQLGTTGDQEASKEEVGAAEVVRFNKAPEAIEDLKTGRIDAVILDQAPAKAYVSQNEGLIILDEELTQETYSLACFKGDEEFTEFLNSVINEIKESGKYDELLEKYGLNK